MALNRFCTENDQKKFFTSPPSRTSTVVYAGISGCTFGWSLSIRRVPTQHDAVEHDILLIDVPGQTEAAGPLRHQRHVIAGVDAFAEFGFRVGRSTFETDPLNHMIRGAV